MARQEIDLTTPQPNGKMGEPTKAAWEKVNDMTAEIYPNISTALDNSSSALSTANSAQSTANAAAPKASPSFNGTITSTQSTLETGVGAVRIILDMASPNGDDDRLQLLATRIQAGSGWTGVIWRLRRIVNGFQQGIIEFGQPASNTGVTIDGGKPWTSANTTVDANNFIKRA